MTHHPLRLASVVVGVLLSVAAISAQTLAPSVPADVSGANARKGPGARASVVPTSLIRRDVALPSSTLTPYLEGELVRVQVPSNWRELPGFNAVTFAPEGAYGSVGIKSVFTHGLEMGLARNDNGSLPIATDDFIDAHVLGALSPGRPFRHLRATIGDRPGLRTVLSRVSEATGELERIEVFTTLLRNGALFYLLAVSPRDGAADYAQTFRNIVASIEITDCDSCVR
jgi:hypothetical protein